MARFMRKGTTKVYFVLAFSDYTAPTAVEFDTGTTELTPDVSEVSGFTFSNSPIQTPDMDDAFVSQIPGEDTTEESGLVFYEDNASTAIRSALAKDTNGYIVFLPQGETVEGDVSVGDLVEVWPVTVSSNARRYSAGNEAGMYEVKFATTAPPAEFTIAA